MNEKKKIQSNRKDDPSHRPIDDSELQEVVGGTGPGGAQCNLGDQYELEGGVLVPTHPTVPPPAPLEDC